MADSRPGAPPALPILVRTAGRFSPADRRTVTGPDTDRGAYLARVTFLTYPQIGASAQEPLPEGYRQVRRRAHVGNGTEVFRAVASGMQGMRVHRHAGLAVRSHFDAPSVGARFSSGLRLCGVRLWAPCEFVWIADTPDCYGYGFGTVTGHPESGEEAMEVAIDNRERVEFTIRAFSRHSAWYARLGAPVARLLQDRITDGYVDAARRLAVCVPTGTSGAEEDDTQ